MMKTIITLEAEKEGTDLILKVKIDEKIEEFYKKLSNNVEVISGRWHDKNEVGLKFYKINPAITKMYDVLNGNNSRVGTDTDYDRRPIQNEYFDDFGSGLLHNGMPNLALLRIKGASNGITFMVNELVSYEELKEYINRLAERTKHLYSEFIVKSKVKAKITFEV